MTGSEICDIISNTTYNTFLYHFAKVMKDETCSETMAVGCQIILVDTGILVGKMNAGELAERIIDKAACEGSYAGLEYVEAEMLPPDDPDHEDSDCGFAWVCFEDLWAGLEKACESLKDEEG